METSLSAGLWRIEADSSSTESALLNLILNARDAMPLGGKLTIETSNVLIDEAHTDTSDVDLTPGRYVMLTVSDVGHGIPAETLSQIFEPFFSSKPPGAGSGLGLSMIQGFMYQSGGTVVVHSDEETGTTFRLYFPAFVGQVEGIDAKPTLPETVASSQSRVLLAEDEPDVRTTLLRILEKAGYSVTAAESGDEALEVFRASPGFDLLVSDIVMPGSLQGPALVQEIRKTDPDLPVVLMSGYVNETTVPRNGLRPEDIRLMKPVMRDDLLSAIKKALNISDTQG